MLLRIQPVLYLFILFVVTGCFKQEIQCHPPADFTALDQPLLLSDLELNKNETLSIKEKTALINVWAIWCFPCREELPLLDKLTQNKHLGVYLLNLDDAASDVENVFQQLSIQHLKTAYAHESKILQKSGAQGLPLSLLYLDGELRYQKQGAITKENTDQLAEFAACRAKK